MKASSKFRLSVLAGSLAFALLAVPASAANEARANSAQANVAQLNEEGAALYAARDYRRAIEKFIQAYAVDSDPNLLFNIARCYEELGESDAAIEKYEAFLKTPGADARGRQRARESLNALREAQEAARTSPAAASSSAPRPDAALGTGAGAAGEADERRGPSYWPWVALGGSIVSAAVGATFYVMGVRDHNEVTDAAGDGDGNVVTNMTWREAQALVDSGDSKKLVGGISLGVAGALAATYVVLLATQEPTGPGEGPSLALDWSPRGSSVTLQGSF